MMVGFVVGALFGLLVGAAAAGWVAREMHRAWLDGVRRAVNAGVLAPATGARSTAGCYWLCRWVGWWPPTYQCDYICPGGGGGGHVQ